MTRFERAQAAAAECQEKLRKDTCEDWVWRERAANIIHRHFFAPDGTAERLAAVIEYCRESAERMEEVQVAHLLKIATGTAAAN